jgi:uncharacterized protein YqeY
MTLFDTVNTDIKEAMRAKEKVKLEALRAIKSAFLLAKTEKGSSELTPEMELKIIQKLVKQRKESAQTYKENSRPELYEKEIAEATVIEQYLPKQMSEQEIKTEVDAVIKQVGAQGPQDMGKVMGVITKKLAGKADNKVVSQIVKQTLVN